VRSTPELRARDGNKGVQNVDFDFHLPLPSPQLCSASVVETAVCLLSLVWLCRSSFFSIPTALPLVGFLAGSAGRLIR
jgi:hypothetical protein